MLNKSNLVAVAHVGIVALTLAALFPYSALTFAAKRSSAPAHADVTFVEPEAALLGEKLARAKMSWQREDSPSDRLHADLSATELPEAPVESVLTIADRSRPPRPAARATELTVYLPSLAAPAPAKIAPEKETEVPAFSREAMLAL